MEEYLLLFYHVQTRTFRIYRDLVAEVEKQASVPLVLDSPHPRLRSRKRDGGFTRGGLDI